MSVWLIVVLVLVAAVIGFVGYLVWPLAGLGLTWNSAPGGPLKFRLRLGSLLPKILGSGGTSLFGVVHIAGPRVSAFLLGHEACHVIRMKSGQFWYLWYYLTDRQFHDVEETFCDAFGKAHAANPFLVRIATSVRKGAAPDA